MSTTEKRSELQRNGHCSAIIKVTGAFEDLYAGRNSPLATNNLLEVTDGLRHPP